jgi:hypothetical protein
MWTLTRDAMTRRGLSLTVRDVQLAHGEVPGSRISAVTEGAGLDP